MDSHPSYPALAALLHQYPASAGALFQTYNDLVLAQHWTDVSVADLGPACARGALRGRRPKTDEILCVVPCALAEPLSPAWLADAFAALGGPRALLLAIAADDASVVYYKVGRGMVKPGV